MKIQFTVSGAAGIVCVRAEGVEFPGQSGCSGELSMWLWARQDRWVEKGSVWIGYDCETGTGAEGRAWKELEVIEAEGAEYRGFFRAAELVEEKCHASALVSKARREKAELI